MKYWNEEKKELQDTPVVVEPVKDVAEDPKKTATKKK